MPRVDPILPHPPGKTKTRRHSNNKGTRQIKQGKTRTQVDAMAKRLRRREQKLIESTAAIIYPDYSSDPQYRDDLTPTERLMLCQEWARKKGDAHEIARKVIAGVRRHDRA